MNDKVHFLRKINFRLDIWIIVKRFLQLFPLTFNQMQQFVNIFLLFFFIWERIACKNRIKLTVWCTRMSHLDQLKHSHVPLKVYVQRLTRLHQKLLWWNRQVFLLAQDCSLFHQPKLRTQVVSVEFCATCRNCIGNKHSPYVMKNNRNINGGNSILGESLTKLEYHDMRAHRTEIYTIWKFTTFLWDVLLKAYSLSLSLSPPI